MTTWSPWRLFPDPRKHGELIAPFGPGCYELRFGKQLLLYGCGRNVVRRMSSLLPSRCSGRNNASKRQAVLDNLGTVEYRTLGCDSPDEAAAEERKMRERRTAYLFST